MTFYSHSKTLSDGIISGSKFLAEHISGVHSKAMGRLCECIDIAFSCEELKSIIFSISKFHDLGKYTSHFQNYLLHKEKVSNVLKQHSRIGGISAYNYLYNINKRNAIIALYLIFQHHSDLINIEEIPEKINDNIKEVIRVQKENILLNINQIETELEINNLINLINIFNESEFRRNIRIWTKKETDIRYYFLINYLFSILIESDKLDASDTNLYYLCKIKSTAVDDRLDKPIIFNKKLNEYTNNELRNYCRAKVIENLKKDDILDNYIFTLTAPTGIGKTLTALDFALKLKQRISEQLNYESPIIYSLPFINIIEQATDEYEKTLPNDVKILAHYQYADIFGDTSENDGKNYNQKLMSLETWQSDVVITSFVQFFETLIGNRNKLLKKFNHFACSIIILDEVQTLRLEQMPLIGAVLYYLAKFLKSRIILMTATRPKIIELAQREILSRENEEIKCIELLANYEVVFECYNRTKIVNLIDYEFAKDNLSEDFVSNIFLNKWKKGKSCLIVCNKVNRSVEIYNQLNKTLKRINANNPIHYLSTNIIPCLRFDIIQKIKNELLENKSPLLISSQVVEAGVDLDFDMGFRDVGPIDSIIQVAGRINRNNRIDKNNSPLYIVDFKDCPKIYGRITYEQSKKALNKRKYIQENNYLEMISSYFDDIADRSSFDQSRNYFNSMKTLKYTSDINEDYPVSNFKIIQESKNTTSVFIENDETATVCKNKYLELLNGNISNENFEKYKRDFNQRIIVVPNYYLKSLKLENGTTLSDNILIVPKELINKYYNSDTGFIRRIDDADETTLVML